MWWKELKLGPSLNKNRWKNTDRPHQYSMTYIKPPSKTSPKPFKNHIRINFLLLRSVRPTAYKHRGMTQKWVTRGHPLGFIPPTERAVNPCGYWNQAGILSPVRRNNSLPHPHLPFLLQLPLPWIPSSLAHRKADDLLFSCFLTFTLFLPSTDKMPIWSHSTVSK